MVESNPVDGKPALNTITGAKVIKKVPNWFIWVTLVICFAPFLLNLFGVDFGSASRSVNPGVLGDMPKNELVDAMHHSLRGAFTHTLLEWSAFLTAIFTVIFAFVHFKLKQDVTTPIIGVALFLAGSMDAFHTLAATRLIEAVADNRDLIPFTWAICRIFNALIMIAGVSIVLVSGVDKWKGNIGFVILISLVFGFIAYGIIHYCATSANLPQATFPDSVISRPYDVAPLILFIFAGLFLFPNLYRKAPDFFTHSLIISMVPQVVTQVHMAFGSTALFDNHFNIAHFLKIIAYIVPFGGLLLDYVSTYKEEEFAVKRYEKIQISLLETAKAAADSNLELEEEIAERIQAENALREEESRMRAILDSAVDGIITINELGIIESFNPASGKLFGYKVDEVIGQNINMLMPSPYHEEHDGYLDNYRRTREKKIIGIGREVEGLRKDKTTFPMMLSVGEVTLQDRKLYTGIIRDITEIKFTEEMLRDTAAQLNEEKVQTELILSGIGDGVIVTDLEQRVILTNGVAGELLGLGDQMFENKPLINLLGNCGLSQDALLNLFNVPDLKGFGLEVLHPITRSLNVTGSNFMDDQGVVAGRAYILRDVTKEQEVGKMKNEFISTVSHELRTPIAAIRGYAQLIHDGDTGDINDTQKDFLNVVIEESDRLTGLISDLLDVEKLESGKIEMNKEPTNIGNLVKEVSGMLSGLAEEKNLQSKTNMQEKPVVAVVDPRRLHQVIGNLFSNSVKYTERGEVGIDLNANKKDFEIVVWDTGVGISEEEQKRLFERFYRVDNSMTREVGGTGLGLSIVKSIVELHNGSVRVESEKGKGSRFIVTVPLGLTKTQSLSSG